MVVLLSPGKSGKANVALPWGTTIFYFFNYAGDIFSEHFEQLFETLCKRMPFQPFTVELSGGDRFEVDHPLAMVVRDGVAVFLRPGGIPVWFDHESVSQIIGDIADTSA